MPDTDFDTREVLRRALAGEPDFDYDLATVVGRGRAHRRRHRARIGSVAAVGVCAVAGAAFVLTPGSLRPAGPSQTGVSAGAGASTKGTPAPVGPAEDPFGGSAVDPGSGPPPAVPVRPTNALDQEIAEAIVAASPKDWVLDLPSADKSAGGIDGAADDGAGPGRLTVGLSTSTQQIHPCEDPEFRAGGTCSERTLADGAVLSQRGVVTQDGIATILVVLTYPDGSGVSAESGNYLLLVDKAAEPSVITAHESKPVATAVRSAPTYSVAQLTAVVRAVDAAVN